MARQIAKNPDGSYTVDGKYKIVAQDARYNKFANMYNQQRAQPTGVSVTGQGGVSTSGTGQKDLDYNYNNGNMVRTQNGLQFYVKDGDPRQESIAADYARQNGGIYASGNLNNPTGYDRYANILKNGYKSSREAAQRQIDAAVNTLQSGIGATNATYDNANKAAYINYMMGQKGMAQQLAASGLGKTGASESTRLAANLGYSGQVNSNEGARASALQDIYNRMAETRANGAVTLADIDREQANNQSSAYMNMLAADREQMNADRDYRLNKEQMDYSKKYDLLDRYISAGADPQTIITAARNAGMTLTAADLAQYTAERNKSIYDSNKRK